MEALISNIADTLVEKQWMLPSIVALTYFVLNHYFNELVSFLLAPLRKIKKRTPVRGKFWWQKVDTMENRSPAELLYHIGVYFLRMDMPVEACRLIGRALELEPRLLNGRPYVTMAECYLIQRNKETAATLLDKATDWFPSVRTLYEAGTLYAKLGRKEKAKSIYKEAFKEYKVQLKWRRHSEKRWAFLALLRSI